MRRFSSKLMPFLGLVMLTGCGTSGSGYTSTAGNYRVNFPGTPKEFNQDLPTPVGILKMHMIVAGDPKNVAYTVMWTDYPPGLTRPETINNMLEGAATGCVSNLNGKELGRTTIDLSWRDSRGSRSASRDRMIVQK